MKFFLKSYLKYFLNFSLSNLQNIPVYLKLLFLFEN